MMFEKEIDIILVQEPNKSLTGSNPKWIKDLRSDTAIYCINPNCGVVTHEVGLGFVCLIFNNWALYNCYISPNCTLEQYKEYIDRVMEHVRDGGREAVVVGDFNAKSAMWAAAITDTRGDYLAEWIQAQNMVVHNEGETPTFTRGTQSFHIDITLSTQGIARNIQGWEVSTEESLSLHKYISFEIRDKLKTPKLEWRETHYIKELDFITKIQAVEQRITSTSELTNVVRNTQKECLARTPGGRLRNQPAW
nr:uncharacterized protein LOC111515504 [Leptinotarsa decemlineata]